MLYDKESASSKVIRFRHGMYELEVNADNFESGKREIYIPKAGKEPTIVLAKQHIQKFMIMQDHQPGFKR